MISWLSSGSSPAVRRNSTILSRGTLILAVAERNQAVADNRRKADRADGEPLIEHHFFSLQLLAFDTGLGVRRSTPCSIAQTCCRNCEHQQRTILLNTSPPVHTRHRLRSDGPFSHIANALLRAVGVAVGREAQRARSPPPPSSSSSRRMYRFIAAFRFAISLARCAGVRSRRIGLGRLVGRASR
jgi:hypothetical protein